MREEAELAQRLAEQRATSTAQRVEAVRSALGRCMLDAEEAARHASASPSGRRRGARDDSDAASVCTEVYVEQRLAELRAERLEQEQAKRAAIQKERQAAAQKLADKAASLRRIRDETARRNAERRAAVEAAAAEAAAAEAARQAAGLKALQERIAARRQAQAAEVHSAALAELRIREHRETLQAQRKTRSTM